MNPLRILIVDDELPARERMKTLLADIQENCPHVLIGAAHDGQEALDLLVDEQPDLVLLDVQMPGMTGIELAQHISKSSVISAPAIVFVTAYDEYALEAFEVHAMDYLLKPVRASRLQTALEKVSQQRLLTSLSAKQNQLLESMKAIPKQRQNFSVLEKNRMLLIPIRDVLFLKAEQKYVTIQTKNRAYLTEESLVSIEAELGAIFVRAHRNALVARDAIIGVERTAPTADPEQDNEKAGEVWQVLVRDSSERLPVSRRQWAIIKSLVR